MKKTLLFKLLFTLALIFTAASAWAQVTINDGEVLTKDITDITETHTVNSGGELIITGMETEFSQGTTPALTTLSTYVVNNSGTVTVIVPSVNSAENTVWVHLTNSVAGIVNNMIGAPGDDGNKRIRFQGTSAAFPGVDIDLGNGFNTIEVGAATLDGAGTITNVQRMISVASSVGSFNKILNHNLGVIPSLETVLINPLSTDGEVTYTGTLSAMDRVSIVPGLASSGYELAKLDLSYGGDTPAEVTLEILVSTSTANLHPDGWSYFNRNLGKIGELIVNSSTLLIDVTSLTDAEGGGTSAQRTAQTTIESLDGTLENLLITGPGNLIINGTLPNNVASSITLDENFEGWLEVDDAAVTNVFNGQLDEGKWTYAEFPVNLYRNDVLIAQFETIQAAIDAAIDDDVIEVAPGTYIEQLVIDKSLEIYGFEGAIIQAPPKAERITQSFPESAHTFDPIVFIDGGNGYIDKGEDDIIVTLKGFEVDGNDDHGSHRFIGILARNTDLAAKYNSVYGLLGGGQNIGILTYGGTDILIHENTISEFNRNAITIMNATGDEVVKVTNNTIIGRGYHDGWAQNGIQLQGNFEGEISGNTLSDIGWIWEEGTRYTASGILALYNPYVLIKENTLTNVQVGIRPMDASFKAELNIYDMQDASELESFGGIWGNPQGRPEAIAWPFEDPGTGKGGPGKDASFVFEFFDNEIHGDFDSDQNDWSWGLGIWPYDDGKTVIATVTGNKISGWATAIDVWGDDDFEASINDNSITDNLYGAVNFTNTLLDATCNWWGTTDAETIDAITWGKVDWSPFLMEEEGDCGDGGEAPVTNLTIGVPYASIEAALDEAEVGDNILIASGDYGTVVSPGNIVWSYGASPGCVTFENKTYKSTDIVEIDIWGLDPFCGNEEKEGNAWYDQIKVTATATLNRAKLDINLYNDKDDIWYSPEVDDQFTILTSDNLMGNFMEYPGNYVRAKSETGHKNFAISYDGNEVVLTTLDDRDIDIAINELGCAGFEVVVIPRHNDLADDAISNLQFTIKYPLGLTLTNTFSPVGIEMELGETLPDDDYQYITFVGTDLDYKDWNKDVEQTVLTFRHDQDGTGDKYGEFTILSAEETDPIYAFYVEYLGSEVTGDILTLYDNDDPRVIGLLTGCPVHNTTQVYPVGSDPAQFDLFYYKIQDAISGVTYPGGGETAGADVGDVLEAATWTFVENVVVDVAELTLQPMTDAEPIIDGDGQGDAVVIIEANEVTLTGFTVQNSHIGAPGIAIAGASECLVEDNLVQDNGIGIAILATDADANENIIRGNVLENNVVIIDEAEGKEPMANTGYGIIIAAYEGSLFTLTGNVIDDNDISGSKDAIYITEASSASVITNNLLYENYVYGIQNYKSDNNIIQGNTIINNGIVGNLEGADYDTPTAKNTAGIRIGGGQDNEILNNLIYNETETGGRQVKGIRLFPSDDRIPDGNSIHNNSIYGHNEGALAFNLDAGVPDEFTADDLEALLDVTCNWWGTADINTVLAGIRGAEKVEYLPLLINDDEKTEDPEWPNGFNPIGPCEAPLTLKVWLQGPYDDGEMGTALNTGAQLPTTQPYSQFPWNYPGTEQLPAEHDDAVDWVLVELRDSDQEGFGVIDRFAGLLNKEGSITASFTAPLTKFHVVVYHRNHMPVMYKDEIDVSDFTFPVDLTAGGNVLAGSAIELNGGTFGMIAGDVTHDGRLQYSGPGNDRGPIIAKIISLEGGTNINQVHDVGGYFFEDVLMNNILKYIGADNDRDIILANLRELTGSDFLNVIYESKVPVSVTKGEKEPHFNDGPLNILVSKDEIRLQTGKHIENGLVDNIQFTLAWNAGDDQAYNAVKNASSDFLLRPQGEPLNINGVNHQVFVSVFPKLLPQNWYKEEHVTVMTLGDNVSDRIWIADNQFTMENNAMFFVSVWGTNFTGDIMSTPTDTKPTGTDIQFRVYPNPVSSGILHIDIPQVTNTQVAITVFDLQGNMIKNIANEHVTGTTSIDVSELSRGIYFLQVDNNESIFTARFVVTQ